MTYPHKTLDKLEAQVYDADCTLKRFFLNNL